LSRNTSLRHRNLTLHRENNPWNIGGKDVDPDRSPLYSFVALDTRTPCSDEHAAADAGKAVHYVLRWQNAKGEPGPWSSVLVAKVPLY
jgi:hypothetical protein